MNSSLILTVYSQTDLILSMNDTLDINALSQESGISVRTIRYYLAQNLLLPPFGRGPAAVYGPGHRDRLRLIRRLQDAHLPLSEIRKQLQAMDDASVARALVTPATTVAPPAVSAYDYVRQVLAQAKTPPGVQDATTAAPGDIPPAALANPAPSGLGAAPAAPPAPNNTLGPRKPQRSNWERIALHPDIELHVRRPLARSDQRRLDELLDLAMRLFEDQG